MEPIPREVKDKTREKWERGLLSGVSSKNMDWWWRREGRNFCSLCSYENEVGYCPLKDDGCNYVTCVKEFKTVSNAVKDDNTKDFLIACSVMLGLINNVPVIEEGKTTKYGHIADFQGFDNCLVEFFAGSEIPR